VSKTLDYFSYIDLNHYLPSRCQRLKPPLSTTWGGAGHLGKGEREREGERSGSLLGWRNATPRPWGGRAGHPKPSAVVARPTQAMGWPSHPRSKSGVVAQPTLGRIWGGRGGSGVAARPPQPNLGWLVGHPGLGFRSCPTQNPPKSVVTCLKTEF
jgi:hypothetical protein